MQVFAHVCVLAHAWAHMWLPPYWGQVRQRPALQETVGGVQQRPGAFIALVPGSSKLGSPTGHGGEAMPGSPEQRGGPPALGQG